MDQVINFSGQAKEIKKDGIKDLLGIVDIALIDQFLSFISKKQPSEALQLLQEKIEKGLDIQEFAKQFISYLRQGLILKISPGLSNPIISGLSSEEKEKLQTQIANFQEKDIQRILNLFLEAENKIKYSPIPQLPIELAIIESCGIE